MTTNRHTSLGLTDEDVLEMYRLMLLARKIDERMWLLNRAGKVSFVVSGQGQEAAQIGAGFALDKTVDYIAPYYRDLGLVLHYGMTTKETMLQAFAKQTDPNSGGRQMPSHFGYRDKKIITGSSPVATQVPHAAGFALAAKLKKDPFVTFTTLGEGATNQGDFHEALNFAGVHQLPMITMVFNNHYAISVPLDKQIASENVAVRATSYGMSGVVVDGNDPLDVYAAVKKARKQAMDGAGPTLIEAVTDRMTAHSSDDNQQVYRTKEELEEMAKADCLVQLRTYLQNENILTDALDQDIEQAIADDINEATDIAEAAPDPDPRTLEDGIYDRQGGM